MSSLSRPPITISGSASSRARQPVLLAAGSAAKQGLSLFNGSGTCSGCHGIVGVNLSSYNDPTASSYIGPNLTHFASRHLIAGGVLSTSDITKYNWSDDPNCQIVNNHVANPQWLRPVPVVIQSTGRQTRQRYDDPVLSDQQITQLIAYLQTLH